MQINTKYDIGTHIWVVDIHNQGGELYLYDTYINGVVIDKKEFYYTADDQNYIEVKEEDIILYEDKDKLYEVIEEKMKKANEIMNNNNNDFVADNKMANF